MARIATLDTVDSAAPPGPDPRGGDADLASSVDRVVVALRDVVEDEARVLRLEARETARHFWRAGLATAASGAFAAIAWVALTALLWLWTRPMLGEAGGLATLVVLNAACGLACTVVARRELRAAIGDTGGRAR